MKLPLETPRWVSSLAQGAFQALRGFLQLALESIDLLRYIIELFFSQRSCPCDLLNSTIRSAHGGPNFHRDSREPTLSSHPHPPFVTILYRNDSRSHEYNLVAQQA